MKKRIVSAVLALAMALTLLPVSVFATIAAPGTDDAKAKETAPASGYTQVQYVYGTDHSKLDKDGNPISDGWAWQWTDTAGTYGTVNKTYWSKMAAPAGLVNGTNASGVWYADVTDLVNSTGTTPVLRTSSFTLVGDIDLSSITAKPTSLQVNLFGSDLTLPDLNLVNSITITDTFHTQYGGTAGSVSGLSRDVSSYSTPAPNPATMSTSGLTLNVTGAKITGGITLKGRGNTVTLTDVDLAGGITLSGATVVTNTGTTTTTTYSCDRQSLTINARTTAPFTKSAITGNISVIGNGSNVNLNGATGTGTVQMSGAGGSVIASNGTSMGAVTVSTGAVSPANPAVTLASAPASVTINDATVAGITYTKTDTTYTGASNFTVNAQGKVTGAISTDNGTVTINSANVDDVTVKAGTLNVTGSNGTLGDIVLGDTAATKVAFNFSGSNYKGGDITKADNATVLTIGANWPANRSNVFGAVDLKNYTGQGIKGGVFKTDADTPAKAAWFSPELQFFRNDQAASLFYYYGKKELATAIADAGAAAATDDTITVIGWNNGSSLKYVEFYNSMVDVKDATKKIAGVAYGASTAIYLPNMINGTPVASWTDASTVVSTGGNTSSAKTYGVNELVSLSSQSANVKLVIQASGAAVTKLTNATAADPNQNITVTMTGNQITLSGAVGQASFEDVEVTCVTDLIGTDGTPVTFPVVVSYDTTTKVATISTLGITPPPQGVVINTSNNTIQVGGNTYTVSVSGLTKPASELKVAGITTGAYADTTSGLTGKTIVPTVTASMGNAAKQTLIDAITGTGAEFDWTTSPAMQQVVNQAMTTITNNNQIANWATAAQRAAWNLNNKGKSPTETDLLGTGYTTVVVEPYLAMNITVFSASGATTATLTPSYRVLVVSTDAAYTGTSGVAKNKTGFTPEGYYIAQTGRALNTPITDLTKADGTDGVTITLPAASNTLTGFTADTVMHQDGTYVYKTTTAGSYLLTRGGKTGLGTVVFNTTPELVSLTRTGANVTNGKAGTYYYDNLQAAVNDTLPQADNTKLDKITVNAAYTGSGVIDVTGTARIFEIETIGQTQISNANNNFTVGVDTTGHKFTVQLQQNVASATGSVEIAANTANFGTITPSVNKAKAGDVVTITAHPSQGYKVNTITAVTNTNAAVAVKSTGTANQYTFTVPQNVTKVVITPSFVSGDNKAAFTVNTNTVRGTASVYTGTSDGKLDQGKTATVTVHPSGGNRTVGLTARADNGATVPTTRTAVNQFTVTVPSGATLVTVTPTFDVDNGTPFTDVLSSHWASPDVSWIYNKGYTTGYGTQYTFAPAVQCTRWEMVTFLWKAAGYPEVNISNPFTDVSPNYPNAQAYKAIMWAASRKLIDTSTGRFNPTAKISRADAVNILYKQAGSPYATTKTGFKDVPTSAYYAKAVSWAEQKGITNGKDNRNTFKPNDTITRQEIAKMLHVAFG